MPKLRPARVDLGAGPQLALVRDPNDGTPLPEEGRDLPLTAFWLRRLRDGDVEIVAADNDHAGPAGPHPAGPADPSA